MALEDANEGLQAEVGYFSEENRDLSVSLRRVEEDNEALGASQVRPCPAYLLLLLQKYVLSPRIQALM